MNFKSTFLAFTLFATSCQASVPAKARACQRPHAPTDIPEIVFIPLEIATQEKGCYEQDLQNFLKYNESAQSVHLQENEYSSFCDQYALHAQNGDHADVRCLHSDEHALYRHGHELPKLFLGQCTKPEQLRTFANLHLVQKNYYRASAFEWRSKHDMLQKELENERAQNRAQALQIKAIQGVLQGPQLSDPLQTAPGCIKESQ